MSSRNQRIPVTFVFCINYDLDEPSQAYWRLLAVKIITMRSTNRKLVKEIVDQNQVGSKTKVWFSREEQQIGRSKHLTDQVGLF